MEFCECEKIFNEVISQNLSDTAREHLPVGIAKGRNCIILSFGGGSVYLQLPVTEEDFKNNIIKYLNTRIINIITDWILEHKCEYTNIEFACVDEFKDYIYDSNGQALPNGNDIKDFITDFVRLLNNYNI